MSNEQQPEVTSFEIELDNLTLHVPDSKRPTWHGPYHDGMLTIYATDMSGLQGEVHKAAGKVGYLGVYSAESSKEDFLSFNIYDRSISPYLILNKLIQTIFEQYCTVKATSVLQRASDSAQQYLH